MKFTKLTNTFFHKLPNKLSSFAVLLGLLFFTSCVPAKKYKTLLAESNQKDTQLVEAKATISTINTKLEALEEEKRNITQDIRKLTSGQKNKAEEKDITIQNLRSQVKILENKVATLENKKKIATATGSKSVKKQKNTY